MCCLMKVYNMFISLLIIQRYKLSLSHIQNVHVLHVFATFLMDVNKTSHLTVLKTISFIKG